MYNPEAALSAVAIANFAAGTLDEYPLTSFDQDTSLSRFMARHYSYARDQLLQMYPASFARKRATLTPTTAPSFGWSYAYNFPTDCIRMLPLKDGGTLNGVSIPYEIEGRTILTNAPPPLKVRYIRRVINEEEFTPLFGALLGARLAVLAATRITGKVGYFDKASATFAQALNDFKTEDSLSAGTPERYDYGGDDWNNQLSNLDVRDNGSLSY